MINPFSEISEANISSKISRRKNFSKIQHAIKINPVMYVDLIN